MQENEQPGPDECDEDENTVAKSIIDEIIDETEREDPAPTVTSHETV